MFNVVINSYAENFDATNVSNQIQPVHVHVNVAFLIVNLINGFAQCARFYYCWANYIKVNKNEEFETFEQTFIYEIYDNYDDTHTAHATGCSLTQLSVMIWNNNHFLTSSTFRV